MIPEMRTWAGIRIEEREYRTAPPRRRRSTALALEALESRRLLSAYSAPSANLPVEVPAGAYLIQVSGPGVVKARTVADGAIDISAYGTTDATTITIIQTKARFHFPGQLLPIQNLLVRSGQIGGLQATPAELTGKMTPLASSVNTFEIGELGPKSQVNVDGSVDSMSVSSIDLGPIGHFEITGDLNSLNQSGPMTIGAVTLDGGRFTVGRDSIDSIEINGDLSISQDGLLSIGRDQDGTFSVNGSILLNTGGQLLVGRNLGDLSVTGNVIVGPSGSGIAINGAITSLTVDGYFQGQGGMSNPSAIDLGVGLNLSGLTILGGISGQGGLINANIRAGGTVSGDDVAYGTYNSTIQTNTSMAT
jgi:hypothetical protein